LGDDAELYREVLQRFFDESPQALSRIAAAIELEKAGDLHRAAHSYKGLAAMSGTEEVARTAAELEQIGKQGQLQEAPTLLTRLRQELERAQRELAPYYR
jgi:HPt (histidine-containing phosphotransfer) domain-containing protein